MPPGQFRGQQMAVQHRGVILQGFFKVIARIRFDDASRWTEISLKDDTSDYFAGANAVAAVANPVNLSGPFIHDHIVMHPDDFRNATKLREMYEAILAKYEASNWVLVS